MKHLCNLVRSILTEESNVQPVSSPVTICGDIHGQLWDLVELFKVGGECPSTSYIFMVIYVSFSLLFPFFLFELTLIVFLNRLNYRVIMLIEVIIV